VTFIKRNALKIVAALLALLSVALRAAAIPYSNHDLVVFNLVWYDTLAQGVARALATGFANYAPPYTYFLALATLTRDFISPLTAIKLIPAGFDIINARLVYKLVRLKFPQGSLPYLAAALHFSAPTIMLNSSYWGQADALYVSCLLLCLYFLLTEKTFAAMLAFGMSFAFKAQAVFLIPFLFALVLRKKIRWFYFGLVPLVYLIAAAPVVLLGRPVRETLLIYAAQSNTFNSLTMNAPNLYYLLPREWLAVIVPLGILVAAATTLYWSVATAKSKIELNPTNLIFLAFVSLALTPYLLPKMHDRYFYPADVLSIVLAFYIPALWFVPILYQIVSFTAVSGFLFNASPTAISLAVLLNSLTLAFVLKKQLGMSAFAAIRQTKFSLLAWSAALLTPVMLCGLTLSFILSPYFLRAAYGVTSAPSGINKSERFHWASVSMNYLSNDKKTEYLKKLRLENNQPVFNDAEIALLDSAKHAAQVTYRIIKISLLGLFVLALLAWISEQLPAVRRGVKWGGGLSIGLGIIFALAGICAGGAFRAGLQNTATLARLFPIHVWQGALLFVFICLTAGGFILTKAERLNEL
jgi:Gpi18-like mannosyltransferase